MYKTLCWDGYLDTPPQNIPEENIMERKAQLQQERARQGSRPASAARLTEEQKGDNGGGDGENKKIANWKPISKTYQNESTDK